MPVRGLLSDDRLETYWITFPGDSSMLSGIGVTAYSEEDAFALVTERGLDHLIAHASTICVTRGVRVTDLDPTNILPNIGPMQFRGVWYPAANVGFGAPSAAGFRQLDSEVE